MTANEKAAKLRQAILDLAKLATELDCEYELSAKDGTGKVHKRYVVTVWVPVDAPEGEGKQ